MLDAYLYGGKRSAFGRHGGVMAKVRPDDMLGGVIRDAIADTAFEGKDFDDVIVGCGNQAGEDSRCVARHAGLLAGLPIEVPGQVIQRNCASGLSAIIAAAHATTVGEGDLFIAGGVESMTRAPTVVGKSETAFSTKIDAYDSALGDRFPNKKLKADFGWESMPETADNIAKDYQITREQADIFALASQMKYKAGNESGYFKAEITPVTIAATRRTPEIVIDQDEHPRANTNMEGLAKLRPLFEGGVTTAGNASGINDGAVATIIGSLAAGEKAGAKPMARIIASASAGVPPRIMGIGPVPASQKALERAGLTLADMDVIEINEAFAVQVLGCLKGLGLAEDDSRINLHGGAIALGHPLGASGPRIALTAARQLERTGGRYALATLCVGIGQGTAIIIERV
ncbi:acetyl-CoA C-acyltransferase [bacterium AH-315-B06]|nr:acetyl-CoA C-acyltransferase [bacterium AH-315-B06]